MKKFLTVLVLLNSIAVFAQDVKITWGPDYKKDGGMFTLLRYGGHTDKAYYVVEQSMKNTKMFFFDFKHNALGEQEIDYKFGKSDLTLEDVYTTKSGNYFFMTGIDKKEDKGIITYTTPTKSNNLNPNFTKILEYPYSFKQPFSFMGFGINMGFDSDVEGSFMSYDSSKVLYMYSQGLQDAKSVNQKVTFLVMDDKMKVLYKVNKTLSYTDKKFDLIDNSIMNNGDVYFAAKHYENDKDRKTPNYKFHILKITSANVYKDIIVKLNDAAPLSGSVVDLENGNIMVVGSYTNISNNKSLRANGTYSIVMNADGAIISNNIYPFSGDVKEELFGENEKKAEKGAMAFKVKRVMFDRTSKTVNICFEKDYITTTTTSTSSGTRTTIYYHTDDIIVARFALDGKREFESVIDKKFTFPNTNHFNSFNFSEYNGNYYFLFNDAKTMSERKEADVSGRIVTDLVKMDKNGKIIFRKTLFGNKDIDMMFAPKLSDHLWKNEVLIHGSFKKHYKYGILYLPE
jgi:hypothetical protein